jgi:hypothetical protein
MSELDTLIGLARYVQIKFPERSRRWCIDSAAYLMGLVRP